MRLAGWLFMATALTGVAAASAASADGPAGVQATASAPTSAAFEQDRRSILAMAGDYRVRFDFRETVSFLADYQPIDDKVSGCYEAVRVVEDTGQTIRLQHLLVVEQDGKTFVVKHWRQDWSWQPVEVLTYQSSGSWKLLPVAADRREGTWSQTVYQTDDSPRYGGVGRWVYDDGVARWTSDESLRPLARRDAVRKPPYDHYVGVNRHALTPTGWIHEQDNAKVGQRDGKSATFVHEVVLNTYDRNDKFNVKAADDYWAATKDYWAAVRMAWAEKATRDRGVAVAEEAQNGSVTGPRLMGLADDIAAGKTTTQAAVAQARLVVSGSSQMAAASGSTASR